MKVVMGVVDKLGSFHLDSFNTLILIEVNISPALKVRGIRTFRQKVMEVASKKRAIKALFYFILFNATTISSILEA